MPTAIVNYKCVPVLPPILLNVHDRHRVVGDVSAIHQSAFFNCPVCIGTPAGIRRAELKSIEVFRERGGPIAFYEARYNHPVSGERESIRVIYGIDCCGWPSRRGSTVGCWNDWAHKAVWSTRSPVPAGVDANRRAGSERSGMAARARARTVRLADV